MPLMTSCDNSRWCSGPYLQLEYRKEHEMEHREKWSIRETPQRLGVSPFTVRTWLRQGKISYHRLGRRIVLDQADVEAFLAGCRVEARNRPAEDCP